MINRIVFFILASFCLFSMMTLMVVNNPAYPVPTATPTPTPYSAWKSDATQQIYFDLTPTLTKLNKIRVTAGNVLQFSDSGGTYTLSQLANLTTPTPTAPPTATPTPSLTPTPTPTPNPQIVKVGKQVDAEQGIYFTTIQSAIDSIGDSSASKPYTILVYAGIYAEQVNINENYVSLVGTDKTSCIIKDNPTGTTADNAVVLAGGTNCEIKNLTIENSYDAGTDGETALTCYSGGFSAFDCNIISHGRDTIWIASGGTGNATFKNCYIAGDYDIISGYTNYSVYDCIIEKTKDGSLAVFWASNTGSNIVIESVNNRFIVIEASYHLYAGSNGGNTITFNTIGDSSNLGMLGNSGSTVTENLKFQDAAKYNELTSGNYKGNVLDLLTFSNSAYLKFSENSYLLGAGHEDATRFKFDSLGLIQWYDEGEQDPVLNLYNSGSDTLKTDFPFDCAELITSGTTRINSAGVATLAAGSTVNSSAILTAATATTRTITLTAAGANCVGIIGTGALIDTALGISSVKFIHTEDTSAAWTFVMPENWDGGDISAEVYWTTTVASKTVRWKVYGNIYADGEEITGVLSFANPISIESTSASSTITKLIRSTKTGGLTFNKASGTPAGGQMATIAVVRDNSVSNNVGTHVRLLQLKLYYTINQYTE